MAFAFHILGTSSSGNCSLLEASGTRVMLDAGFPGPRLEASLQKLGLEARALDAVMITTSTPTTVSAWPPSSARTPS